MPVGAITGAVGLYTAKRGRDAAKDSARKQADAIGDSSQAAIDEQRRQFDLTRGDMMPWLDTGKGALGRLDAVSNGDFSAFQESPGRQFRFDEGMKSLDRSAASRGSLFSGGTDLDRINFGQGQASNEFNNWWNRQAGLAGVGQATASSLGQLGQSNANSIGNLLMNAGNARASSFQQQGQANADMWGNVGGIAGFLGGQWGGWGNRGGGGGGG